jgi:malonyl-CoA O-methyltransferase
VRDALLTGQPGALGWREWRRLVAVWDQQRAGGRIAASFEIVYGHAWKPQPRVSEDRRNIIRLDLPGGRP